MSLLTSAARTEVSRRRALLFGATLAVLAQSACSAGPAELSAGVAAKIRLGFQSNLTHATPLVGVARGHYARHLGHTELATQVFNAGPEAVEAMFSGSLDAAYLGQGPAVTAWVRSRGEAVTLVAGATVGGAELLVRKGIHQPRDLVGTRIASPGLGGSQDVALRAWLIGRRLRPDIDVRVEPTPNATTFRLFQQGRIDGGWLPEPWASRLLLDAGAHVLVDERTLWPGGVFVTAQLMVSTSFLRRFPRTVTAVLAGHVDANDWIRANPAAAKSTVNSRLAALTGGRLRPSVLDRAWAQIRVTNDPIASSIAGWAANASAAGFLTHVDLRGLYDLRPLNALLLARGKPPVRAAGLGPS